ncbi:MAG: hypothetical protein QNJ51_27360 [Calothrix sp. MO_167.B12]|nr:hypothetical protein [Calothrix sp. MO_167.B12]
MTANSLPNSQPNSSLEPFELNDAQDGIYNFFMDILQKWHPEDVLLEFQRLFIDCLKSAIILESSPGIYGYFTQKDEHEFRHTLKRCCYILINNWETSRQYQYIQELISIFSNYQPKKTYDCPRKLKIYRSWLENFIHSKDYQELKLFADRHNLTANDSWVNRYSSFLFYAQSLDFDNPQEQQEAARKIAKKLKDKFKFDLAMYTARSQSNYEVNKRYENPSSLGDEVLRLIKAIVIKKGVFSYENIANIFVNQTQTIPFEEFKHSLLKYLIFSIERPKFVDTLQSQLSAKLLPWKDEYNQKQITGDLFLRTCNRVLDFLTTENREEPSPLFVLLLSQGHPLTLVIVLLKIILVSKNSRSHLEMRIADLIRFYESYPEKECSFFINFLEIFNITFAIYAENVEYNLIPAKAGTYSTDEVHPQFNPDAYHVFSQLKFNIQS